MSNFSSPEIERKLFGYNRYYEGLFLLNFPHTRKFKYFKHSSRLCFSLLVTHYQSQKCKFHFKNRKWIKMLQQGSDKSKTLQYYSTLSIFYLLDSKYFQLAIFHSHGAKSDFISWMNG